MRVGILALKRFAVAYSLHIFQGVCANFAKSRFSFATDNQADIMRLGKCAVLVFAFTREHSIKRGDNKHTLSAFGFLCHVFSFLFKSDLRWFLGF